MIAVAIISILAAIAVPTYRDYTVRAKISEALNLTAATKISITEYYISEGTLPTTLEQAGITNLSTNYVASIAYSGSADNGRITVTLSDQVGGDANGKQFAVEVAPTHGGTLLSWSCTTTTENGVNTKYLPANCR